MTTEQTTIIEGNKLIDIFYGIDTTSELYQLFGGHNYHESWQYLMPVVEKIESIHDEHHGYFGVHISSNSCTIQATKFRSDNPLANPPHYFADYTADTKINATWQAVVQFIQWYNKERN